ncbi:MAG: response regulator [Pseudobdellovibrionaceae bacterium]
MKVICTDDNPMHLSYIQQQLKAAAQQMGHAIEILGTATNGLEGFKLYESLVKTGKTPDFCTFDIRMPELDGLSALLKIQKSYPSQKIIMVSSEDEVTMSRKNGKAADLPQAEKMTLLKKVEDRILKNEQQPGKINKILDACEELLLDPVEIAMHYGAKGYLQKPYQLEATVKVLKAILGGSTSVITKR